jgi:hypothetical protein
LRCPLISVTCSGVPWESFAISSFSVFIFKEDHINFTSGYGVYLSCKKRLRFV